MGILVASFFWIPAVLEIRYVHSENLIVDILDFHRNFIPFDKLLVFSYAPQVTFAGKQYFQIGGIYIVFFLIALMRLRQFASPQKYKVLFFILCALMSTFLILPISRFIWEHVSIMKFVSFPWRFLGIIVFATSFIVAGVCSLISQRWRLLSCVVLAAVFGAISISHVKPGEARFFKASDAKATFGNVLRLDAGEFTPIWVKQYPPSFIKDILIPVKKELLSLIIEGYRA